MRHARRVVASLGSGVALALAWACSGPGEPRETECDNRLDDDSDGLTDCMDPDCDAHAVCAPDGDGDADSDADTDADSDGDTDVDADADADPTCGMECPAAGDTLLQDVCQWGDCYPSGDRSECCVASSSICRTTLSVGDLYTDLSFDWRGFFDNDHECKVRILETDFVFSAQTRGEACAYGFIRVQVRGRRGALELGRTYRLCDDPALGPTDLRVNVTVGETEQVNYTNSSCEVPGSFVLTSMGDETGQPYAFELEGSLSEIDGTTPTGERVNLSVGSAGRVVVE